MWSREKGQLHVSLLEAKIFKHNLWWRNFHTTALWAHALQSWWLKIPITYINFLTLEVCKSMILVMYCSTYKWGLWKWLTPCSAVRAPRQWIKQKTGRPKAVFYYYKWNLNAVLTLICEDLYFYNIAFHSYIITVEIKIKYWVLWKTDN